MSYVLFIIKSALEDFGRNKTRTFLTSLGILIGVASVVLLVAFGLGLKKYIKGQFESLGTNLLIALPGNILKDGGFSANTTMGTVRFDQKDIATLNKIKNIAFVVPYFEKSITAKGTVDSKMTQLNGSTSDFFTALNLTAEYGELFTKGDLEKKQKVAVIGPKLAKEIFGSPESAVGKILKASNQPFRIIGVTKAKGGGGLGGPDFDSYMYVPYTAAASLNPDKTFAALYVKAIDETVIPQVKEDMNKLLEKRYDSDDFSVIEQTQILDAVSSIFGILNIILIAIAAISLIVGGIGIMNIMYVSVVERIREIGIRRALGATKRDILAQFLAESILLSLLGGLLGLSVSFVVVLLIQPFFPAYIDTQSVLLAVGVSSAIGIIFGVFPAKKAADLSPMEAIRYE